MSDEFWDCPETELEPVDDEELEDEKCIICGGQLDEQLTCQRCLEDLPQEKFTQALEKCLQDVSLLDVLHAVPGIYEIISEEYNNEALDQAYQDMVDEYDHKETTRERLNMLGVK